MVTPARNYGISLFVVGTKVFLYKHAANEAEAAKEAPRGREQKIKDSPVIGSLSRWLLGVGATDRYAYMGASLNRRLLGAKLVYAAQERCSIP